MQTNEQGETSVSVYSGELTKPEISRCMAKIKGSFPGLPPEYYSILIERLYEKGFSDERLKDAVNHVIDTCIYPNPSIANFLSFDKKVRLYTYSEMVEKVSQFGKLIWDEYEKKSVNGKMYWIKKDENICSSI